MAKKERRVVQQFTVGDKAGSDFTVAEIELLIHKLAEWFRDEKCDRKTNDPLAYAREVVEQCLNASRKDGSPWKNAPIEFKNRIKIKAAYDMESGVGIPMPTVKSPDAVRNLKEGADENRSVIRKMNPNYVDFNVDEFRQKQERELLEAYPDLNTPAMLPHVRRLTLLYAQQEMIDRDLAITTAAGKRNDLLHTMETLNKTLDSILKILDIHPESIRKKIKESADGNLGDLVASIDDDDFRSREKLWSLQAALQLWMMTVRPNGRGDGPQIDAFELWHMTRCKPFSFKCKCGRVYPHLVDGFTPKELKDYLIKNKVLISKPVLPNVIPPESVVDIEQFIDSIEDPNNE